MKLIFDARRDASNLAKYSVLLALVNASMRGCRRG